MAAGSSMLATIRTVPPQWTQAVTSMEKTRLRRCAQLIERRFSSGLRGASFALASAGSTAASCRLPRPEGVNCAPPRQNSCRPDRSLTRGREERGSGSIRTSVQGQGGGSAVAA